MFETLLQTVLLGGGTGLIGTLFSFGTDWLKARQRHAQEVDMRRIDLEIADREAAGAAQVARIEAEGDVAEAEAEALTASFRQEMTRFARAGEGGAMLFVDVVRGLLRPSLTVGFVVLTGFIYFTLTPEDAHLKTRIIETVLYLATTCTVWWFGGRQVAKSAAKP